MSRAVVIVRTANRPEVLRRCLTAIIDGCEVARTAHWLVLDDSSPNLWSTTREVLQFWKAQGVLVGYANESVEDEIASSLPGEALSSFFRSLVATTPACRTERGRNLGLLAGLSLNPDVLFLVDDDIVHRHGERCFFHWCANSTGPSSFIAAPRKCGIGDMSYLDRLIGILDRDDWAQFISENGLSATPKLWYSPENPLWKPENDEGAQTDEPVSSREVLSGQLMALRNGREEWLPFPSGYNEDLNWSLMQSAYIGTPLLKVRGADARHLPPCLVHPPAESIFLELVGTAITRAIRQIQPRGEETTATLELRLPEALGSELKRDLFLFLDTQRAILSRLRNESEVEPVRIASKISDTLSGVGERLKSVDSRLLAMAWLDEFGARRRMFRELRLSEPAQYQIRRALFG